MFVVMPLTISAMNMDTCTIGMLINMHAMPHEPLTNNVKTVAHHIEFVSEARHKEKKNRNGGKIVTEICNKCFQTQPVSFFLLDL